MADFARFVDLDVPDVLCVLGVKCPDVKCPDVVRPDVERLDVQNHDVFDHLLLLFWWLVMAEWCCHCHYNFERHWP